VTPKIVRRQQPDTAGTIGGGQRFSKELSHEVIMSTGLKLSRTIPASADGPQLCTLTDALHLIDRNLPKERRHVPHWRRARELLTKALRSKDPDVIEEATDHLERALRAESGGV
jgi:hypothetical protein